MNQEGLRACPFCGCRSFTQQLSYWGFCIICTVCNAEGPSAHEDDEDGKETARKLWNERT